MQRVTTRFAEPDQRLGVKPLHLERSLHMMTSNGDLLLTGLLLPLALRR
jgi:hypothetical protein